MPAPIVRAKGGSRQLPEGKMLPVGSPPRGRRPAGNQLDDEGRRPCYNALNNKARPASGGRSEVIL